MKKLKPHRIDWAEIVRVLASADKKLASAHKIRRKTAPLNIKGRDIRPQIKPLAWDARLLGN